MIRLYRYLILTNHKVSDSVLESVRKEFRRDMLHDNDIRKKCFRDELFD